jgi:hypothetical protein
MLPYRLGRNPSPKDERDYKMADLKFPLKGDLSGSKSWAFLAEPLNQEQTNHCVGFAAANFGINLPIQDNYTNQDGHDFYYKCKILDGEPTSENGTNLRSVAKVLKQLSKISSYAFATSTDEITLWLLNKGPMIVGTKWTMDMFTPDSNGIIRPTGEVKGGHGYLLNEKTKDDYYHIQNSWGYWGIKGGAYISISDFAILLRNDGEAIAAVESPVSGLPSTKDGCLTALLKIFGMGEIT